jgi:peptidoglycan/LPS O-acetylase OafA/YrhL
MSFGVTLFFALSAYLITSLLIREQSKRGTVNVGAFYARRSLRIWPLYFTFLAFSLLVLPRIMHATILESRYQPFFWLFGANWACALWDYPVSPDGPLWSISTEEQFYLLFPLLLRFLPGRPLTHIAVFLLIVSNGTRVLLAMKGAPEHAVWFNPLCQLDPIAGGILLGSLPGVTRTTARNLWPWAAVGVVAVVVMNRYFAGAPWAPVFMYPLAAVVCLLALGATLTGPQVRLLQRPTLVYLGKISFGLYVFHALALELVGVVLPYPSTIVRFTLGLALTVLFAALSYRFLELPFLKLKDHFASVPSRVAA